MYIIVYVYTIYSMNI